MESVFPPWQLIAVCAGKLDKILEHGRDQRLPTRILTLRRLGKKAEQIMRLLGGLRPARCRRGKEMGFELVTAFAKRLFIRLDLGE